MESREFRGQPCPLYGSNVQEIEDNLRYIVHWWSWNSQSRTGTRGAEVRDLVSKLWGRWFGSHQAPLVRTAEMFQTERNSCPVFTLVFSFQFYWLMTNFHLKILTNSSVHTNMKDKMPIFTTSFRVDPFTCSCNVCYIDCTSRHL